MKVGLTTLYHYNYGSALQCYALQSYIKQHFCDCELLCKEAPRGRLRGLICMAGRMGRLCMKSPGQAPQIIQMFLSQRAKNLTLQAASQTEIQRFVRNHIQTRTLTWKGLCRLGSDPAYGRFITGSDQVWNGSRIDAYDMFFLRFAPKEKRIAYAPSFGGSGIANYNKKKYRKYISEFAVLSAREESGADMIRDMTGRTAPVLADPVCLLDAAQWRERIRENTFFPEEQQIPQGDYILAFFLDRPSETALKGLKVLREQKNCPVYSIGYRYASLDEVGEYRHLDGSPWAFLRLIDGAGMVVTDSFHATVFSLIFGRPFYAFSRSYTHSQDQSVRVTGLMKEVGMADRFDSGQPNAQAPFSKERAEAYFAELRSRSHAYLTDALGAEKKEESQPETIELLSREAGCCGCGACKEVCPVGAITMERDGKGAEYPVIDREKCVKCGACVGVCALKKDIRPGLPEGQRAYVGFGTDETLVESSSSGGIFAVLARAVLARGGAVFGAAVCEDDGGLRVRHICVEDLSRLNRIQGSKYTQSETTGVFTHVKKLLKEGRMVLFSGTSCQVAALKAFLKQDYPLLYTVDLVCHGVPGPGFFEAHNEYLEKKYRLKLTDISFRRKDGETPYVLTLTGKQKNGKTVQRQIKLRNSAYYRLFMGCEGYRESCYSCPYASLKKPADITLGDYAPSAAEKEALAAKPDKPYYSFIMANSEAGQWLLEQCACQMCIGEITLEKALKSHPNLRRPSIPADPGLWELYKRKGFEGVQRRIDRRNLLIALPRLLKGIIEKREG